MVSFHVPLENPFFASQDESTLHFLQHFPEEAENKAIARLLYGTYIKKLLKKGSTSKPTFFYIHEEDFGLLQWISKRKQYTHSRVDLKEIRNITEEPTDFKIKAKKSQSAARGLRHILCIDFGTKKTLTLEFQTEDEKRLWWQGLQFFIVRIRIKHKS